MGLLYKLNILIMLIIYISKNTVFMQSFQDKESLELVAVLHRHGDKTPAVFYKNDPYKDVAKYWPIGVNQLTKKGKTQLYNVGKLLRKKYKNFIPRYSVYSVKVNSSDMDRCLMSSAALLAGLFPPEGDDIWNDQLIWQPIPIHTLPVTQDKVLAPLSLCPRFTLERESIISELARHETEEDKCFYQYLTENMGQNISLNDIPDLHATFIIEERNGLILPEWTKKIYPEKMNEIAQLAASTNTWNKLLKRFYGGPVIKEILHQFKDKSEGLIKDKLLLYSAHDLTIINTFRALEFKEYLIPDFGATLTFELHRYGDTYYVRMFYSHFAETVPYELKIPECTVPCTLDMFLNITEYVRSVDWNTQCFE
ncbi:prostatic acid phosphatase-like [Lycorma delicatula]|uniref:prostatic acid phosphatase-like n=1 Tax=Lycorma delicatula TaxID=130591 RepID=UPI003F5101E6